MLSIFSIIWKIERKNTHLKPQNHAPNGFKVARLDFVRPHHPTFKHIEQTF